MKHVLVCLVTVLFVFLFNSCESCIRKTTEKVTKLGLTVLDTASDVIAENGEKTAEKAAGAMGSLAKGLANGLRDFTIDSESNGEVVFVETADHFNLTDKDDSSLVDVNYSATMPKGSTVEYFGKLIDPPAIVAVFAFEKAGNYEVNFELLDKNNTLIRSEKIKITPEKSASEYTYVGFAFTDDKKEEYESAYKVKISVL